MAPQQEDERGLVERLRRGDTSALAELYDRHASTMLALGVRVLKDRREAEDLLHDVFLEAWEQTRAYDPARGTLRAWLLMRMRSRALDRLGSAAIARRVAWEERPAEDAQNDVGHDQERLAIRTVLEEMPDELREVLHLTYYFGMTAREVAAQVGLPEGTVRSRIARGIALLDAQLQEPPRES